MKICIDAGHGGYDSGAVNEELGLKEKDIALAVTLSLQEKLVGWGYEVVLTRSDDSALCDNPDCEDWEELQPRCDISNEAGADIFISIHCNACNKEATGIESWYCEGSRYSKALATCIQERLVDALEWEDRGIKEGRWYVIRNTECTAVLIELGFIDNNDEGDLLSSPDVQERMAFAIAKGICDFENPF